MPKPECHIYRLGLVEYSRAWEIQKEVAQKVAEGQQPNTLLLLEHLPVYTIGRRGSREQVLLDDETLHLKGIAIYEVDRGGQVTFHGPGQLVGYPILELRQWGGPLKHIRTLEQIIVKTLADFGIKAGLVEGLTGVWVGEEKIAAIGVKIRWGVSYHGFALNVNTDLSYFQHIIPCGITDRGVTSIEKITGNSVDIDSVAYSLVYHFGQETGFRMVERETLPKGLTVSYP